MSIIYQQYKEMSFFLIVVHTHNKQEQLYNLRVCIFVRSQSDYHRTMGYIDHLRNLIHLFETQPRLHPGLMMYNFNLVVLAMSVLLSVWLI